MACGKAEGDSEGCTAGETRDCSCARGTMGTQECRSDGLGWESCDCETEPAGGGEGPGMLCAPGSLDSCTGSDGCQGARECLPDGTGYGPCECASGAAGSGTGATGGSGGQALAGSGGESSGGTGGAVGGTGGAVGGTAGAGGNGGDGGGAGATGGAGSGGGSGQPSCSDPSTLELPAAGSIQALFAAVNTATTVSSISIETGLRNTGTTSVPLQLLTLRYWYTPEDAVDEVFDVFYAAMGAANVTHSFGADYVELGFAVAAGELGPGQDSGIIDCSIHEASYAAEYDQSNDYSFDASITSLTPHEAITVYYCGELIWGREPA
jgi:hypothetical protein